MKEMTTEIAEKNGVVAAMCCQHCSHYTGTAPCSGDCSKLKCRTYSTDVCNEYLGNNEIDGKKLAEDFAAAFADAADARDGTAHDMNGKIIHAGDRVEYRGCRFDVDEISDSRHVFLLDDYSNSIEADPKECEIID